MKHFLRFRGCHCPKRIQPIYLFIITTLLLTVGGKGAFAQRALSGTVVDTAGSAITGATVTIKGTSTRTLTDDRGRFTIRAPESTGTFVISYLGHQPITEKFDTATGAEFHFTLVPTDNLLEEVEVSTGYQTIPKERATGSFVHIDNELLNRSVGSNILDRLDGVTRGLIFNQSIQGGRTVFNNQPSISIRGRSTLFANAEPLIILDNFPFEGSIDAINPEDIESVTLLQDAAAASIWGARAGNGVIVLTSKGGRFGQRQRITVRSDRRVADKPDLFYAPVLPIADFIEVEREIFNRGAWNGRINQVYPYITPAVEALLAHRNGHIDSIEMETRLSGLKTQDVRRDLLDYAYRPSELHKVALSLQGGSGTNGYFLSTGFDRNVGEEERSRADRFTLNARNNFRAFRERFQLDAGILLSIDQALNGGHANHQVIYDRLAGEDGYPLSIGGGFGTSALRQSYIDTAGNGSLLDWNYRPLDEIDASSVKRGQVTYQLNAQASYRVLHGIDLKLKYQFLGGSSVADIANEARSFDVRNSINQFSQIDPVTGEVVSAVPSGGRFRQYADRVESHSGRGEVSVEQQWGMHRINGILGMELYERSGLVEQTAWWLGYRNDMETFTPFDFSAQYLQYHTGTAASLALSPSQPSRESTLRRNRSYFGNLSYSFRDRYTATFSARKDEANIFGAEVNKRGRPFWSAGLAWHAHNEGFLRIGRLNRLSLRATYGRTGNVSEASALITSSLAAAPHLRTGRIYQTISNPPNPLLGWESIGMVNMAVDFSLLAGRFSGSVEHYRKKASDLLSSVPINPTSGVASLYGNWSSLKGSGWDLSITALNLNRRITWKTDLITSLVQDEVTQYKLTPSNDRFYLTGSLGTYPIVGKPLYGIYSLAWGGLDGNGQPRGYLDGEASQDYAGIYNNTRLGNFTYHGRATPTVFGSLRNSFSYEGVDLSVNITYRLGYYFRRAGMNYSTLYNPVSYGAAAFQWDYTNRWRQPGDEAHTHVPVAQYPVVSARENFYGMSSVLVERGDHIRIHDVRLGYRLSPKLLDKLGLEGVSLFLYLDNLGLLWAANRLGIDPDAIPGDQFVRPVARTYSLGIDIKL